MAQMTFLDIVNRVIDESKVTLDQLTSANFASPPRTSLYGRIKNWVNTAYEELLEERTDWQFRTERTTITIYPRLYVQANGGYTPLVGATFVGASSGVTFTVVGVSSAEEIENDAIPEYTLDITLTNNSDPSTLIVRESLDLYVAGVLSIAGALTMLGLGRYDFSTMVPGLENINMDTVRTTYVPADAVLYKTDITDVHPVIPVPWSNWPSEYDLFPFNGAQFPGYISEAPNGQYALYPIATNPVLLGFDYRRKVGTMSAYSDIPEGLPDRYHMYLVWRAVEELADYDKNGPLYARAKKHLDKYDFRLMRDEMPRIRLSGWNGVYTSG